MNVSDFSKTVKFDPNANNIFPTQVDIRALLHSVIAMLATEGFINSIDETSLSDQKFIRTEDGCPYIKAQYVTHVMKDYPFSGCQNISIQDVQKVLCKGIHSRLINSEGNLVGVTLKVFKDFFMVNLR